VRTYSAFLWANLALYFKAIIALFIGLGRHQRAKLGLTVGCFGFQGVSFVPAVAEIEPQWADQLQVPQGLIWSFGAETDLLNLRCRWVYKQLVEHTETSRPRKEDKHLKKPLGYYTL